MSDFFARREKCLDSDNVPAALLEIEDIIASLRDRFDIDGTGDPEKLAEFQKYVAEFNAKVQAITPVQMAQRTIARTGEKGFYRCQDKYLHMDLEDPQLERVLLQFKAQALEGETIEIVPTAGGYMDITLVQADGTRVPQAPSDFYIDRDVTMYYYNRTRSEAKHPLWTVLPEISPAWVEMIKLDARIHEEGSEKIYVHEGHLEIGDLTGQDTHHFCSFLFVEDLESNDREGESDEERAQRTLSALAQQFVDDLNRHFPDRRYVVMEDASY